MLLPLALGVTGSDPEAIPWTRTRRAISDLPGEDDDPAVVVVPGDHTLHLYHRTTGVRAQELTGAVWADGCVHLFVIEQGSGVKGIRIAHLRSRDPGAIFAQAHPTERYLIDQPARLESGGHFTPVVRDGKLRAAFWTVRQSGPRYGLQGHPARFTGTR